MSAGDQAIIYPAWTWEVGFIDRAGRFVLVGDIPIAVGHFQATEIAEQMLGTDATIRRVLRADLK
jgi:hypothetical protein